MTSAHLINQNVARLSAPPVAVVQDWISSYNGARGALIDLSQAVPGYPPHPDMAAALGAAASHPDSHNYGFIEGEPSLRAAYAAHLSGFYQAAIAPDQVMITSGCNQAFITTALTIAGPGQQVLMTNPCYFNHEATLHMLGIETGYVNTSANDGFIPALDAIAAAITPQTRALALVNPNNPTGAIIPQTALRRSLTFVATAASSLFLMKPIVTFCLKVRRDMICCKVNGKTHWFSFTAFRNRIASPGIVWGRSLLTLLSSLKWQK